MDPCEFSTSCPFFEEQLGALPGLVEILKKQYCLLVKSRCARYRIVEVLGREHVPSDLFPNDIERANQIIEATQKARKRPAV